MNHFYKLLFTFLGLLINLHVSSQSNVTHTIVHDNVQRSFIVHLPPGYNANTPISCVFNLHGSGMTGAQQQFYTKMDLVSNAGNFIVVYPNGLNNTWQVGSVGAYDQNTTDVEFIGAVLDTLLSLYNINEERVFSCGVSQGGYMSHRLACDLQDRFAAVAAVAGSIADSVQFYCDNSRKVPTLFIHGVDDPYVPYSWAEDGIAFWTNHNGCIGSADITNLPNTNAGDGSTVDHHVYDQCDNHAAVELYRIAGGGHTWPGASMNLNGYGNTNHDISASQEIWNFFNRFSIHGSVAEIAEDDSKETVKIFPNPVLDEIHITGITPSNIVITDMKGTAVMQTENNSLLNVSKLTPGFYLVTIQDETRSVVIKLVKR